MRNACPEASGGGAALIPGGEKGIFLRPSSLPQSSFCISSPDFLLAVFTPIASAAAQALKVAGSCTALMTAVPPSQVRLLAEPVLLSLGWLQVVVLVMISGGSDRNGSGGLEFSQVSS